MKVNVHKICSTAASCGAIASITSSVGLNSEALRGGTLGLPRSFSQSIALLTDVTPVTDLKFERMEAQG